jgi:endo-1,3-1,4-beta-glycanase ExoK
MFQLITQNAKRAIFLGLSILAAVLCVSCMAAQVPSGFGTTPIFDEEFNRTSLDASLWTYRDEGAYRNDGGGAHHNCRHDSSAVKIANGYARIYIYTANNPHGVQTHYCGALTTQGDTFLNAYGYWEASVRFQYRLGMQCSFWLQSPSNGYIINDPQKSGTEMDVFEHIQSANATSYDHAVWWNGYGPYTKGRAHVGTQSNLDDGKFHTFGLAWTPESMTFYVDGVQSWHLYASDVPISSVADYIILDTELPSLSGVPLTGYGPLGSSSNAYMDVDYVRVYPYIVKSRPKSLNH